MEFEFRDGIQTSPDALSYGILYVYRHGITGRWEYKGAEENTYLALAGFLIAGV